jgi:hypothetical protein
LFRGHDASPSLRSHRFRDSHQNQRRGVLGKLDEGGALVQARGRTWGQLLFQDLFKKDR